MILMICVYVYRVFFIIALPWLLLCRRTLIVSGMTLREGYMPGCQVVNERGLPMRMDVGS